MKTYKVQVSITKYPDVIINADNVRHSLIQLNNE